ncbi:hypothetical protein RJ639_019918 [Escallonia herrerae]|uniref:Uncharacterized protein n=1 Tax=Escallonia herrerae TaxID=1293975 RepID=A0AA88V9V0_9ASTE|nr:hypothetical protein RJ639_019918 [Escallonia herrerae]
MQKSMKSQYLWSVSKNPVKFRILLVKLNGAIFSGRLERSPISENLVPIRLDIEIDGQRFRDAFTWNPADPDSEVVVFAKRTVKDLKLPPAFITQIVQSIQDDEKAFILGDMEETGSPKGLGSLGSVSRLKMVMEKKKQRLLQAMGSYCNDTRREKTRPSAVSADATAHLPMLDQPITRLHDEKFSLHLKISKILSRISEIRDCYWQQGRQD